VKYSLVKKITVIAFLTICSLVLFSNASAHTPLKPDEENHSIATAFEIPNPTKSWTLYRELHEEGEADYFKLQLEPGERLVVSIYTSKAEDPGFAPYLAVIGPDIPLNDVVPDFIEVPEGAGVTVLQSSRPDKPEYEPFTPSSYYYLVDYEREIQNSGTYYLAIYQQTSPGRYGMAVGYKEEFTILEWLKIPLDVIEIHQWEEQSLFLILAPLITTLSAGFVILIWRYKEKLTVFWVIGSVAGLLYLGTGFMILTQMIIALNGSIFNSLIILTVIFLLIPLLLGFALLRKITRIEEEISMRDRLVWLAIGVLGLFMWAGLFLGPALSILAGLYPSKKV